MLYLAESVCGKENKSWRDRDRKLHQCCVSGWAKKITFCEERSVSNCFVLVLITI